MRCTSKKDEDDEIMLINDNPNKVLLIGVNLDLSWRSLFHPSVDEASLDLVGLLKANETSSTFDTARDLNSTN